MNRLQQWAIALGLTVVAVVVSYLWIDRPLAFFAHDHLASIKLFSRLTYLPEPFSAVAAVILVVIGIRSLSERPMARVELAAVTWSVSVVTTSALKNQLKVVFGRTWPETWINNNPSLIHDGAFGFNPLHGGAGYESFPSGHTAAICAAAAVLWICYPRFRAIYTLCVAAVVIGLIGANYHFLSDIIAGGFLGASVAIVAVKLAGVTPVPAQSGNATAGVTAPGRS